MIPFLLRVVAGTAALPIALTAWIGASAAQDADDPIVATVNGQEIRRDQVLEAIQRLPQQIQANMPLEALVPAIAQQLATSWLMAERGYAENLQDSQEVKDQVAAAERRIVQNVWLDQEVAARIAEDAVDQAYQDYLAANPPSEEVRARHILVGTEDEAKDLIDQLNEGAVFADLAAEFSVGPSGPRGGDLGFFNQGQMVEPFAVAAFALQPGEVYATPVETQFGWHVIKVEERRMTEQPSLEDLRSQLESGLADDVIQGIFAELRDGAEIVVYGPDGEPMEN